MSSSQTLIQRSEAAQKELKKLRFRFQFSSWITGIVGIVILGLLTGYFVYGYSQISELKDPQYIVSLVGQLVDDQIPQARREIQSQVDKDAEKWAQLASDEVLEVVPTLRVKLEDFAAEKADEAIDHLNVIGEQEFRRVLDENRDTVTQAFQDLEDDDEISEGVLLLLEQDLAEKLQIHEDALAGTPLVIVSDLNRSGKNLLKGEKLSEEQEHERRVLMVMRRLQDVQFPDLKFGGLTLPSEVTDSVEELEHVSLDKKKDAAAENEERTAEPPKKEATEPAAEEAPKAKDDTAAKPEAEKTDPPKEAPSDGPSDDKEVAEAKPEDK